MPYLSFLRSPPTSTTCPLIPIASSVSGRTENSLLHKSPKKIRHTNVFKLLEGCSLRGRKIDYTASKGYLKLCHSPSTYVHTHFNWNWSLLLDVTPRRKENRCMAGLPNPSILHQLPPAAQMHREDRRGHTAKKWILFIILSLASTPQCWVLEKETLFSTFP